MIGQNLPQAACLPSHGTFFPSWFCSWREVDLQSLKGSPDEENEEVMAWSYSLRRKHTLGYTYSRCLKTCGCQVKASCIPVLTRKSLERGGTGSRIAISILKLSFLGERGTQ